MKIKFLIILFIAVGKSFASKESMFTNDNIDEGTKTLVNEIWLKGKEKQENFALILFDKIGNEDKYKSKDRKIIIELENDNEKTVIKDLNNVKDTLKTATGKWALFEIKTVNNEIYYLYCSDIETGESSIVGGIFDSIQNFLSISVLACDTSKVINMRNMFYNCLDLNSINFSNNIDTSNVENMGGMFSCCTSLINLDLSKFNTEKVTNMTFMFNDCSKLADLDLSSFNTKNVTDMGYMFNNCSSLTNLDLSSFNTEKVILVNSMFDNCQGLKKINLSGLNFKKFSEDYEFNYVTDIFKGFFSKNIEEITVNKNYINGEIETLLSENSFSLKESNMPSDILIYKKAQENDSCCCKNCC